MSREFAGAGHVLHSFVPFGVVLVEVEVGREVGGPGL
jgi:hypothetical protein